MRNLVSFSLFISIIFANSNLIFEEQCTSELKSNSTEFSDWDQFEQLEHMLINASRIGQKVFVEEFVGVNCPYCGTAAWAMNYLLELYPETLVLLQWHSPYYSPNSGLAIYDYYTRGALYDLGGIPHVRFNGYLYQIGAVLGQWQYMADNYYEPLILGEIENETPYIIDILGSVDGSGGSYEITVSLESDYPLDDMDMQIFLTEDRIWTYWAGLDVWQDCRDVVRIWLDTEDLNISLTDETQTFSGTFDVDETWNLSELYVTACVQNMSELVIKQGETERVSLENILLMDSELTSISNDDDGDSIANPGESMSLNILVSNISDTLTANNVVCNMFSEGAVEILNPEFDLGNISVQDGNINISANIQLDENIELGELEFLLTLSADFVDLDNNSYEYYKEFSIIIDVNLNQSGWPLPSNNEIESSPLVMDIDNNSSDIEIVFTDHDGYVHIVNSAGDLLFSDLFPFNTGAEIWSSPAAADIDNDSHIEVIVTSTSRYLYVFDIINNEVQLEYFADQQLRGTPAIGNLDDDDELEIVFGGYSSAGKIFAINPDGTDLPGFPLVLNEKIQGGVALADFNENDKDDIVCATDSAHVWLIYDDSVIADGFPFLSGGAFKTAPSIIEIDSENIIFATCDDSNLYAINSDGSIRFTKTTYNSILTSPGIVEIENGAGLFFGAGNWRIYGVDLDGNDLPGWPVVHTSIVYSPPVFADLDSDGSPEVISGADVADILAYHLDGTVYEHFPIDYEHNVIGAPTVNDLDGDGDIEILIGSEASLICIDVKETGTTTGYWHTHKGNFRRTGFLNIADQLPLVGDVTEDWFVDVLDVVLMVAFVLEDMQPTESQFIIGDINEDGSIDVLDVVMLVELILGNN